jgi:hypothetical protein
VEAAFERGWSELQNGQLLDFAEKDEFEVLVTTDQGLRYQQNLSQPKIAILVLTTANWPAIRLHVGSVAEAIATLKPGDYREIAFPKPGA